MSEQEVVALTLVAGAALFLLRKLGGRSEQPTSPPVVASSRLQKAMRKAEDKATAETQGAVSNPKQGRKGRT